VIVLVLTVIKKLTRTGNSIAAEVEVSTNGQVIVITPKRTAARDRKFRNAAEKINRKYAGLFKRLSE
jgi:hypothetical protein